MKGSAHPKPEGQSRVWELHEQAEADDIILLVFSKNPDKELSKNGLMDALYTRGHARFIIPSEIFFKPPPGVEDDRLFRIREAKIDTALKTLTKDGYLTKKDVGKGAREIIAYSLAEGGREHSKSDDFKNRINAIIDKYRKERSQPIAPRQPAQKKPYTPVSRSRKEATNPEHIRLLLLHLISSVEDYETRCRPGEPHYLRGETENGCLEGHCHRLLNHKAHSYTTQQTVPAPLLAVIKRSTIGGEPYICSSVPKIQEELDDMTSGKEKWLIKKKVPVKKVPMSAANESAAEPTTSELTVYQITPKGRREFEKLKKKHGFALAEEEHAQGWSAGA